MLFRSEDNRWAPAQRGWSVQKSLDDMERGGVATSILSLPHSVHTWPADIRESRHLARDWNEFMAFPDQGTVVARAVEQAVGLFNAFDYLDASGNLMVIFTDGADADVLENGKTVDDVLADAQKSKIPVYLIKIGGNIQQKRSVADDLWIGAVKKTGGEFFSGGDEATIIKAIQSIDRRAAGKIEMKQYSTERPRYQPFAMIAALLWCGALMLRFTIPTFQTFP